MSIKDKAKLSAGEMEIDMTSFDEDHPLNMTYPVTGYLATKCGEKGTVKFTPNRKAKDTAKLRMVQAVRLVEGSTGTDVDYEGENSRRNEIRTDQKGKKGEPGYVEKGWMVDHRGSMVWPRTKESDPPVSTAYREYAPNDESSQDGYKNGADIQPCSLWDIPSGHKNATFRFETVAQGTDNGTVYGTVKWNFTIKDSKIVNEGHSFQDNSSATFTAAVDKFNDVYHNPGSPSAPKPATSKPDK